MIPAQDLIEDWEWAAGGAEPEEEQDALGPALGFWHAGLVVLAALVGWLLWGISMRLLTLCVQAGLVGALSYAVIRTVQFEIEWRRWWMEHDEAMKGKARWKL